MTPACIESLINLVLTKGTEEHKYTLSALMESTVPHWWGLYDMPPEEKHPVDPLYTWLSLSTSVTDFVNAYVNA